MRLIQYLAPNGERGVGCLDSSELGARKVTGARSVFELAREAVQAGQSLSALVARRLGGALDYPALERDNRILSPVDHPDPAHFFVTGTGITHLGSAAARDKMHVKLAANTDAMSDSMKMFKLGVEGGKPADGAAGFQPEWFYKGDGSCVVAPGAPVVMPSFALTGGDEAEIAGIYLIADNGTPHRIGYVIANEFSDHALERQNYLYGAHSKLRVCAIGPELLLGALPDDVRGHARLVRGGKPVWQDEVLSGEANMCHSLNNLEHHHFKYPMFRRPGDLHCHFFGAATLSYSSGIVADEGDVFEIEIPAFGRPLRNRLARAAAEKVRVVAL